jgi:predicted ATPase/DNA-binding NarL/FixJ family response regulator
MGLVVTGSLVGRERELAVLSDMVGGRGLRLVTITGPGGVGKTRVAYAVADAVAQDPSWRVLRIDLEPLADAALVADAIAVAVDASQRARGASALRAAADALGDQRALLVLDNFEHLVPAAGDVAALIESCPGVTALVTSRHVLGVTAEHMFPLAPLALPDPDEADPARVARSAAVELFVARARARDPQFELTPEVTAAVAEICRRLDGLPLAIELAAARMAVLPPAALLARWEAAAGLDAPGPRDLPTRQQTLRRAFDWSYELLGEPERALLRRLAAFPGGFDIAAVEAACPGDGDVLPALDVDPLEALAGFVDRSLVARDPGGSPVEPRYSQLRTVRSYLREQLGDHGEAAAADLLMAATCEAGARRAGQFLAAGRSREELDRLERELNNMRAALSVLVAAAPDRAVGLAVDLTGLWETRHVTEGREWVRRALDAGGDDLAPARRASGLWTAALLAHYQGDYAAERPLAVASLAAARAAGDPRTLARAMYVDALSLVIDQDAATARYRELLALCERLHDDAGVAMACNDLGEIARAAGELEEAVPLYERALELWRAGSDPSGVARAAHNLAQAMLIRGELDRATTLLAEALEASRSIGDRTQEASTLAGLAAVAAAREPSAAAATLYGAAQAELDAVDIALDPLDAAPFHAAEAALRAALGDARFTEASARGRQLSDDERRRLVERIAAGAPAPASDLLTRRELEVVRLIAAGLTNGEIAQRLVVSDHTVHRHVSNILGKLGVPSRAAAASLAAQRGLL